MVYVGVDFYDTVKAIPKPGGSNTEKTPRLKGPRDYLFIRSKLQKQRELSFILHCCDIQLSKEKTYKNVKSYRSKGNRDSSLYYLHQTSGTWRAHSSDSV